MNERVAKRMTQRAKVMGFGVARARLLFDVNKLKKLNPKVLWA